MVVEAPVHGDWDTQLEAIEMRYSQALWATKLTPQSAVFRRIFVSDVLNQTPLLKQSSLVEESRDNPVAVSLVQQQPLPGAKIAMLAYHVISATPAVKRRLSPHPVLRAGGAQSHLWSTGLCAGATAPGVSAAQQTRDVFDDLVDTLADQRSNLRDHCLRTWIYLKDVDVFYHDMVTARSALFVEQDLTEDTHYIASTGIEGACGHQYDVVAMDAYSVVGLVPDQVSYLNDFSKLCPANDYKVTFERATRVDYADRAHYYISGTASIDNAGQVVHLHDVIAQLARALENVAALLHAGAAGLNDLMYLLVYLRDPVDHTAVRYYLDEHLPDLPILIVQGAVCRPEWLIEIEGVAVAPKAQAAMPVFCGSSVKANTDTGALAQSGASA